MKLRYLTKGRKGEVVLFEGKPTFLKKEGRWTADTGAREIVQNPPAFVEPGHMWEFCNHKVDPYNEGEKM